MMADLGVGDSPGGETKSAGAAPHAAEREAPPFDFHSVLQIADTLPVMVAFVDRSQIYRFCNQPIADWFERPRKDILGRTLAEIMGEDAYGLR